MKRIITWNYLASREKLLTIAARLLTIDFSLTPNDHCDCAARAFFLDDIPGTITGGTADLQTTSSFSNSTMKGQFALVMDGWDFTSVPVVPPQLQAFIGPLQFDGSSKLTFNGLANLEASGGGAASQGGMGGPYLVSTNGRITGMVANGGGGFNVVMYAVSGSQAYALDNDSGITASGTVELQH